MKKYKEYIKESLLNKETLLNGIIEVRNFKPSVLFDEKYGTSISQEYKFPFDLTADEVWNIIDYDNKYYDKYHKLSKKFMKLFNNFTNEYFPYVDFNTIDDNTKNAILCGMSSGFNKDDIIWFSIKNMFYGINHEVNNEVNKFPKEIQDDIQWVMSPNTLKKIKKII